MKNSLELVVEERKEMFINIFTQNLLITLIWSQHKVKERKKGEAGERRNKKKLSLSQPTIVQSKSRWDFIQFIIKYSLFCSLVKHLLSLLVFKRVLSTHFSSLFRSGRVLFLLWAFIYIGRNCYVNCTPLIMKIEATLKSL